MKYLCVLLSTLVVNVCSGQRNQKAEESDVAPPTLEMVLVPTPITNPVERAECLVRHYWDKFDFKDATYIHEPQATEQALSDHIDLMNYVSPVAISSSVKVMMKQTEQDSAMFQYFSEVMEEYPYDPDSPSGNEGMYMAVLECLTESSSLSDMEKIHPAHLLELALKSRIGMLATDFTYTLANGQTRKLYDTKADYLLLFFCNLDCHVCQGVTRQVGSSFLIDKLSKSNKLKILAVYPDEDLDAWEEHVSIMPKDWINSYDKSISLKNDEIYDLKTIPTLYLLDKEKKVLLKDATFQQIENYLSQATS